MELFQFLIGRVKSVLFNYNTEEKIQFQFLIGRVKRIFIVLIITEFLLFQFLIGRVKSFMLPLTMISLFIVSIPYRQSQKIEVRVSISFLVLSVSIPYRQSQKKNKLHCYIAPKYVSIPYRQSQKANLHRMSHNGHYGFNSLQVESKGSKNKIWETKVTGVSIPYRQSQKQYLLLPLVHTLFRFNSLQVESKELAILQEQWVRSGFNSLQVESKDHT